MTNFKVLTLTEAIDVVFAYFSTPTILVNTVVNAVKSDAQAIDTALGAMSVGQGFVNMLGKSTPGIGIALSTLGLQRDTQKLIEDYAQNKGRVEASTIWSASSNILATVASFAAGAALLGAAAPALTTSAALGLVATSVAFAVVATHTSSEFDVAGFFTELKSGFVSIAQALGTEFTQALAEVRNTVLPSIANKLEVLTVTDGKVQLGTSLTGAQMQVDPAYLTDFGLDASGNLFAEVVLDSANPYSRVRIAFDETGAAGVTVDGRAAIYVTPGALIRVENQALSVRMAEGSATGEYRLSLQDGTAYVEYDHGAGISGRWDVGANGSAQLARLTLNGVLYSGGDPAAFIAQQGDDFAAQRAVDQAGALNQALAAN